MKGQIQILPLFLAIVHLSRVNLSAVGKRPARIREENSNKRRQTGVKRSRQGWLEGLRSG
jgi:hypothetical protein